jgi:elongation factor 2
MICESFEEVVSGGPLAREPAIKLKVRLTDLKLHEDSIHRGPAQVIPAMRRAIHNAMLNSNAVLYEPLQTLQIDSPLDYFGNVSKLVQNRRGQLISTQQDGDHLTVRAKLPVAELFGFTSSLRSATEGRGNQSLIDQSFEKLPTNLQGDTVLSIRKRKGMKEEIPQPREE